jgi:hypothetical protein
MEVSTLSSEDRRALRDVSRFHEINATTNLPPSILAICAGGKNGLAEPGAPWNGTDVIYKNLPFRRLIWAVSDGNYFVVHYEQGGFAPTAYVLIATLKEHDPKPCITSHAWTSWFKDYAAFLAVLEQEQAADRARE